MKRKKSENCILFEFCTKKEKGSIISQPNFFEAGRPPECSFLLIYEIEISQVITSFHHHIKTKNLTIYFNALFPEVNLFHLNQLAFII